MVRHATDTAVSASISTPVWPLSLAVARTVSPGRFASGTMSSSTLVSASGWQSGINSCVFFAAMMPAMRAAPSTSPFLASPLSTRSSVFALITTRPCATATRSLAALADTSTIRASPRPLKWVSFAIASFGCRHPCGLRVTREQRFGGGGNIFLPHQAFADQERGDAGLFKAGEVGRGEEPALADHDTLARDHRREALGRLELGLEGLQVAIIDADQTRL